MLTHSRFLTNKKTAAENKWGKATIESGKKKQKLNNVVLAIQISQKKVSRKKQMIYDCRNEHFRS